MADMFTLCDDEWKAENPNSILLLVNSWRRQDTLILKSFLLFPFLVRNFYDTEVVEI